VQVCFLTFAGSATGVLGREGSGADQSAAIDAFTKAQLDGIDLAFSRRRDMF